MTNNIKKQHVEIITDAGHESLGLVRGDYG
jgi:hypothetical protein